MSMPAAILRSAGKRGLAWAGTLGLLLGAVLCVPARRLQAQPAVIQPDADQPELDQPEGDQPAADDPAPSSAPDEAETAAPHDESTPVAAEPAPYLPALAVPDEVAEIFDLLNIQPSHFRMLRDGMPIDVREEEALLRFLIAVRRFPPHDLERWATQSFHTTQERTRPEHARGQLFLLRGVLTQSTPIAPIPEVRERYGIQQYYRCRIELDHGQGLAEIFTTRIAARWSLGDRVSAQALFLKWADIEQAAPAPAFVAPRVAWHPDTPLGNLEMDLGLFDLVRNQTDFTSRDRECFYALLAAAGRANPAALYQQSDPQKAYLVKPLFNEPAQHQGELVALTGTARRIIEVAVNDAEIRARFGISRYYQIEIFTADSQQNPLICCVRQLPPGIPVGPDVRVRMRVPGFFYKTWRYPQTRLDEQQGKHYQLAPTIVGHEPIWIPPPGSVAPLLRNVSVGLAMAAILGVWIAVWRFNRSDQQAKRRQRPDLPATIPNLRDLGD